MEQITESSLSSRICYHARNKTELIAIFFYFPCLLFFPACRFFQGKLWQSHNGICHFCNIVLIVSCLKRRVKTQPRQQDVWDPTLLDAIAIASSFTNHMPLQSQNHICKSAHLTSFGKATEFKNTHNEPSLQLEVPAKCRCFCFHRLIVYSFSQRSIFLR